MVDHRRESQPIQFSGNFKFPLYFWTYPNINPSFFFRLGHDPKVITSAYRCQSNVIKPVGITLYILKRQWLRRLPNVSL